MLDTFKQNFKPHLIGLYYLFKHIIRLYIMTIFNILLFFFHKIKNIEKTDRNFVILYIVQLLLLSQPWIYYNYIIFSKRSIHYIYSNDLIILILEVLLPLLFIFLKYLTKNRFLMQYNFFIIFFFLLIYNIILVTNIYNNAHMNLPEAKYTFWFYLLLITDFLMFVNLVLNLIYIRPRTHIKI